MPIKVDHPIEWPGRADAPSKPAATLHPRSTAAPRIGFARWSRAAHHAASVRGGYALVASGKQHKIRKGSKAARDRGRLGGLARAKNAGQRIHGSKK